MSTEEQAKRICAATVSRYCDNRYITVIGFLAAKGLLHSEDVKPCYRRGCRISLKDMLWVAANVEPRVLEVLPAALLHFPSTFSDLSVMPERLQEVMKALKQGSENGPDYYWVKYSEIKRWADAPLADRRVKPLCEKRIARTFRLRPKTIAKIRKRARSQGISDAEAIDLVFDSV